jgi:monovalent cation/proton antiporter MnhG/PhaG subunit
VTQAHNILIDAFLVIVAATCWTGALGMIRMRDPYQALHFLGIPAVVGMAALTLAIWLQTGWTQATWKSGIILIVLAASNSVGTHAAARAFRARRKEHWEPEPDDPEVEFLGERPRS